VDPRGYSGQSGPGKNPGPRWPPRPGMINNGRFTPRGGPQAPVRLKKNRRLNNLPVLPFSQGRILGMDEALLPNRWGRPLAGIRGHGPFRLTTQRLPFGTFLEFLGVRPIAGTEFFGLRRFTPPGRDPCLQGPAHDLTPLPPRAFRAPFPRWSAQDRGGNFAPARRDRRPGRTTLVCLVGPNGT